MDRLIAHPDWCRRADCARTGTHESLPVVVSSPDDLVGLVATLVQLDDRRLRAVRLAVTDDGLTTVVSVPAHQARRLSDALARLAS